MPAPSALVLSPSIPSALGLVAANLVPLVGVIWSGWDLFEVMWLYCAENGIIGLYALLRILTAGLVVAPAEAVRRVVFRSPP